MIEMFATFAQYNGWANYRLFHAAAELSAEQYNQDCGAFFKSMNGTLNHILVGDLVWMGRFQDIGDAPSDLDEVLHPTIDALLEQRRATDSRIIDWADSLTEEQVSGDFTYMPITEPGPITAPLAPCISHFFNHQTHHRGQAHAILTQLTGDAPSFDMVEYYREVREATQ